MPYVDYEEYIQSEAWRQKRAERLEFANHRCELCNAPNNLHVHHTSYENLGDEPIGDLVVLCKNCHDIFHERLSLHSKSEENLSVEEMLRDLIGEYKKSYHLTCAVFVEEGGAPPPSEVVSKMATDIVTILVEGEDDIGELAKSYAGAYQHLNNELESLAPSGIREMALVAVIASLPSVDFPDWMTDPTHPDSLI